MNEKNHNVEIDELISLYLDGEATQRQQTELKRLLRHDPSIAERIKSMRAQQQILNALPVETAPASLVEDVRSAMERNLILENTSDRSCTVLGKSHLFARRLLTAAAMILLPLGVLGLVVYHIISPPDAGPADYVPARKTIADAPPAAGSSSQQTGVPGELPFKGTLVLRTDDYRTVDTFVREAVEKQGLLGQAFPYRSADISQFQITASAKDTAQLADALTTVRPRCQHMILQVESDDPSDKTIEIPDIELKQLKMLVYEDSPELFTRLASRYASANRRKDSLFEEQDSPDMQRYPEPSIPTLAGSYDTTDRTVRLTIRIERANPSEPQQ